MFEKTKINGKDAGNDPFLKIHLVVIENASDTLRDWLGAFADVDRSATGAIHRLCVSLKFLK